MDRYGFKHLHGTQCDRPGSELLTRAEVQDIWSSSSWFCIHSNSNHVCFCDSNTSAGIVAGIAARNLHCFMTSRAIQLQLQLAMKPGVVYITSHVCDWQSSSAGRGIGRTAITCRDVSSLLYQSMKDMQGSSHTLVLSLHVCLKGTVYSVGKQSQFDVAARQE